MSFPRLAFVDIETTGLGPGNHRIAEIGVVTVDDAGVSEWGTLLDPGRHVDSPQHEFDGERGYFRSARTTDLPRFSDIATGLALRLEGRLLIAHNARFDYAFIKSEFERVGIAFAPQVLCTVMLSRKLYPHQGRHDLDTLIERYGLAIDERHRALPDARLLHQFWKAIHREFGSTAIEAAVKTLLAEPLLPDHLDPEIIEALPEESGVFSLLDTEGGVLLTGVADNLRRHVKRYFHLERQCARADAIARQLRRIAWQVTSGPLDARLQAMALRNASADRAGSSPLMYAIRIDPEATPIATIVVLDDTHSMTDLFGLFESARKAANALRRTAAAHDVCLSPLSLPGNTPCICSRCATGNRVVGEARAVYRARHLMQLTQALSPQRLQPWPFAGPIAVRERQSVHVFDRWEFLGTFRTGSDMQALLERRRNGFDPAIYKLLTRVLPRLLARAMREIPTAPLR